MKRISHAVGVDLERTRWESLPSPLSSHVIAHVNDERARNMGYYIACMPLAANYHAIFADAS